MWWKNLLWGFWNGMTAGVLLIVHVFGGWREYPLYDSKRSGGWYDLGFLLGVASMLGPKGGRKGKVSGKVKEKLAEKQPGQIEAEEVPVS